MRAIIELASSHRMTALAEGVETEIQMKALVELGCPYAQGHLFGKARPIDEVRLSLPFPSVTAPERSAA